MSDAWQEWNRQANKVAVNPWRWNIGVARWVSFGLLARLAWLDKDAEVPGISWHKVFGRLYWSDRRYWWDAR
jgi:hypothetical protein